MTLNEVHRYVRYDQKALNLEWPLGMNQGTLGHLRPNICTFERKFSRKGLKIMYVATFVISVYLVYGQASTHIPCRKSYRPTYSSSVCSLVLHACNQDLRSTTCPEHGHATYNMSEESVVCRIISTAQCIK
jgi:hypothetical protein